MEKELTERIRFLAEKFETADFLQKDPSQFMHRFPGVRNQEAAAFISANLALGRREQILSHISQILDAAGSSPVEWILSGGYKSFFPSSPEESEKSFYRMYTNRDMILFFDGLKKIFEASDTLGDFFKKKWKKEGGLLHFVIEDAFDENCALIPHTKNSAAKKLNMLLRWLVREDSPVDLGLWTWYSKENLLMPLDVHVMRQANELGLINSKSANLKTAQNLTEKMKEIFPGDPVRGDYALFGYDIEK